MRHQRCWRAWTATLVAGACFPAFSQTARLSDDAQWHVSLAGFSQHARQTLAPGRQWQEVQRGLGLQRRANGLPWNTAAADNLWKSRFTFGTLEDSRGFLGSYSGMSVMRELAHSGAWRLEGGASMAMHYRSASWNGRMHFVPVILPTLSLVEYRSGFGMDLSWVPPVAMSSAGGVSTLLLQLSYRVEH